MKDDIDIPKIDTLPDAPAESSDTPAKTAPAVHGDTMWGGPQWVENAESEPVWCETKEDYWALLRKNGVRMKDQQESTTGAGEVIPTPTPRPDLEPPPAVAPLLKAEAEIYGAITAVFKRYGIIESIWCLHCFTRHQPHGCRMVVQANRVVLMCRCGVAEYKPPTGTTDLVLTTLAGARVSEIDKTHGTIVTAAGSAEYRPTTILHPMESLLIRRYVAALNARGKEPRWHHIGCWGKNPFNEDDACATMVTPDQIVIVCKCRQLFDQRNRIDLVDKMVQQMTAPKRTH